jgi:predicted  nucleic acid-binding Zn-ribbon protein
MTVIENQSAEEQAQYWKEKFESVSDELENVRKEFEDYRTQSFELEEELEAQLDTAEGTNQELKKRVAHLEAEVSIWKVRLSWSAT